MKVSEAIQIQNDFVSKKYHIFRYSSIQLKESMKTLTNAYNDLWNYLNEKEPKVIDRFIKYLDNMEEKDNG